MPRALNVALGVFLLGCISPVLTHLGGRPTWVQVLLVVFSLPVAFVALLCLASAARPGSLGRTARRLRQSRQKDTELSPRR